MRHFEIELVFVDPYMSVCVLTDSNGPYGFL